MTEAPRCGGAGLHPGETGDKHPPDNAAPPSRQCQIDPRATVLLRAAARYDLLRAGEINIDQAFDHGFVCDFLEATNACPCHTGINQNFDRIARELREERLRCWRRSRP